MLEIKRKKLVIILALILCTNLILAQNETSFDKLQWMKDTVGQNGFRIKVEISDLYLLLLGKNKKQVTQTIGKPDFIIKQNKWGYSFNYCIEGGNYSSKPCKENNCSKSFISIYFINGFVDNITIVWVGG
ncbi:MAG: hypothetical protein ACXITV_01070 [Luteibaculaceae bacterium]